ncbi:Cysteine/Histidine-rich C1 domain family protein [Quillaja saponaria]|uniref:Cysteine/Histidine-rich C1 domain family protein n=1 Tax=Quillaja saponaria TaxID=32244 RepID=A0AAD7LZU5_QUISA|nr:Cysteine/Histidine-rich C1 domain family protein [Quillaja saponaria]
MKYNEISSHFSHPQHKLKFEYSEFPFKCDGCKEVGIGSRYKCSICDYDLHMHCAMPSPSITHPFYAKCSFQFLTRPPGNTPRFCNACEKGVTGFVYHCNSCGFDLHPCCAKLPMVLDDGEIKLYLHMKVSSACHRCGRKGRSWSYRSNCKEYNLHVACVREMLFQSWHEIYVGRGKGRKLETRIAIPSLKNTLQTTHNKKSRGKVRKCCEMAGIAVQVVISAVLGDPTVLIAGVIGSLMSRA